ncbi:MAG: proton-translocating transhydrogenase family protein [Rhizomicrobium sp.]
MQNRIDDAVRAVPHELKQAAWTSKGLGFFALILACVNIFGGFLVTQRMLAMYKKKGS